LNKTFCVITLGCKVNQYESQVICEGLTRAGFDEVEPENAGISIINTCTVTAQSDMKSRKIIRKIKNINPGSILIVTGCGAEKHKKFFPDNGVIFASGIQFEDRLEKVIGSINRKMESADFISTLDADYMNHAGITGFGTHTRCFIKVQDGCDSRCSYCTIPLVRGASRSRSMDNIVLELRNIAQNGYIEIVLTGIHLGQYSDHDGGNVSNLIRTVLKNDEIRRIRLSSIEPQDIDDEFIDVFANDDRLMPHLHLPLQNGNNDILKNMNRRYTVEKYKEIAQKLKETKKDLLLSTDLIIGFPGETQAQFESSLKNTLELGFSKVHVFPFSPRPGTEAYMMANKLPRKEIKRRVSTAIKETVEKSLKIKKEFVGRQFDILVESAKGGENSFWTGFTPNYMQLMFEDPRQHLTNTLIDVKIDSVGNDHLYGKVVN